MKQFSKTMAVAAVLAAGTVAAQADV